MIGQRLGHYRILEKIGAGGMGEVYRAHDERLDRNIALKLLPASTFSDPGARARLLREARSAASLDHPDICTIHEVGEAEGQAYIAMELVEGQPLSARLAVGALTADQVLRYGLQLAEALAHAHERGVVHRDLKSANVVITAEGRAKVLDFGLAKRLSENELDEVTRSQASLTTPGALVGTLAYMAPEQLRGQPADVRSDVWALGVVLYEMAAGERPFRGDSGYELSAAILEHPTPALPATVPAVLQAVVERCLVKDAAKRYASAGEVCRGLRVCQERLAASTTSLAAILRRPAAAAALSLLFAAIVVTTWLWVRGSRATWARTVALPEAAGLIAQGKNHAAFRVLRQAEAYVPDDPLLKDLLSESTTQVSVRTEPAGARVYVRDFFDEPDAWEFLGSAPLDGLRLPTAMLVWKISLEGFDTRELLGLTLVRTLGFSLQPVGEAPPNMVHVPGGRYELFSAPAVELDDYWVDKYEVTNRQFKTFVGRGGYENHQFWVEPFVKDGLTISWEEARKLFRDRTGRPGPSTWELGT